MWFDRPSRQTNECEILHFLRHAFENMLLFFMRTNLIKARGTHTPIHGLGVELTLQGVLFTRLCSKRVFETRVSPVHWPDGFVTLMSLNKGDTAVHGCHCPCEMAVCMREVLATPWVGVCVPLAVNLSYRSLWHTPSIWKGVSWCCFVVCLCIVQSQVFFNLLY